MKSRHPSILRVSFTNKNCLPSLPSFGRASTPGQTQAGLVRGFILLLPQAAVLPGSDDGLDVVSISSSKTVRPRAPCGSRCMGHAMRFVQRRHTRNSVKGRMESPNTSSQAVELNPSCSGQAHLNRSGTGPGHKNTDFGIIFTVLWVPFMLCSLRSANAKSSKVV